MDSRTASQVYAAAERLPAALSDRTARVAAPGLASPSLLAATQAARCAPEPSSPAPFRAATFGPAARDRFLAKVDSSGGPLACWPWTGARNQKGYGRIDIDDHDLKAHRVSLELAGVEVPADRVVMHSCDNPPCVNPAHLRVGTVSDNVREAVQRGLIPAHMKPRTHCKRGHEFTPDNIHWGNDGQRRCLTCRLDYQRTRRLAPWSASALIPRVSGSHRGDRSSTSSSAPLGVAPRGSAAPSALSPGAADRTTPPPS